MKRRHSRGDRRDFRRTRSRSLQFESLERRYVLDGSVVINEIMYHPTPAAGAEADYEWVELYNQMSINMDISGWRLEGGVDYTFAEGTVISGRGYKVIASNPSALAGTGAGNIAPGAFTGRLSNSGEEIVLVNRDGRKMSVVDYVDGDEWPVGPDGSGFSLAKQDQYSDSSNPASWRASRQLNGTPGTANFPIGADPGPALVFNEISAASGSEFWVEIANQSASSFDLNGCQIQTSNDAAPIYTFPSQTIGAGQILLIDQASLGFGATDGDKLFFFSPSKNRLIDARTVTDSDRGLESSHGLEWLHPNTPTPGAANTFQLNTDVVINEIMYHAIPNYPQAGVSNTTTLVAIDAATQWRYRQTGSGLSSNWASVAHPVGTSNWFQGPGVLGYDTTPPPVLSTYPIRTMLAAPGTRITTYYETDFTFSGNLSDVADLSIGHIIDDGAVFYLNGVEVLRYNMPTGTVTSSTVAAAGVEATYATVSIPKSALVVGTNRLSVELHQVSGTTDLLMGAELFVSTTVTPAVAFSESPEEWVELYNKGVSAVDLSGWKFSDAMDYTIPNGTILPAGGYLVVAKDPTALALKYPSITIVGGFSGSLANSSDNIVLSDNLKNPVDSVQYFDSANWHETADGGGSSLELRSPNMDNSKAEAWATSLESSKSDWNTYTYTMTASADTGPSVGGTGNFQWNEFLFGFIESGEVLIDDVSVVSSPGTGSATQLIQNGSFEGDALGSSPLKWRIIGNHNGKIVVDPTNAANKVLDLTATGRTDHEGNNAGTTLAGGAVTTNGTVYQVTFKAKWVSGSPQINSRLFLDRISDTIPIEIPHNNGTPGSQNSTFVANAGPTYSELKHGPVLPSAGQPVTISVWAQDPDGVASMTLFYAVESGPFVSVPMTVGANGLYSASVPGQSSGAAVQFYVQGQDSLGAISTFPAAGANSRAMYEVNDGIGPSTPIESIRIIAKASEAANLTLNTNIMSNQNIGATIIYNNSEVFYDVGLRLKGSSASRGNPQWSGSYSIEFNPDHLFRGVYGEISLDSSGRGAGAGSTIGQQQVQMLVNQVLNHAGAGLASNYDDFSYVVLPITAHTGIDSLQLARYGNSFLDENYLNGSDGNLYEYELVYYTKSTVDGNVESLKNENNQGYINTIPTDLGDDPDRYRWNNILKNNRDEQDFDPMIALNKAFSIADDAQFVAALSSIADVDQWLRTIAAATVMGVSDTFAHMDNYHNIVFYVRPSDGKIEMLPWDWDEAFRVSPTATIHPGDTSEILRRLLTYTNDHVYFSHLYDLVTHEMTSSYMTTWVNYYYSIGQQDSSFLSNVTYISQRHDSVLSQIGNYVPSGTQFNITTNGGSPVDVTTPTVSLNGTGYIDFHSIRVRGSSQDLDVTWSSYTDWQAVVPLNSGVNNLILDAYDVRGNLIHSDSITVTTSATVATPFSSLRVTEMNYHPVNPPDGSAITDSEEYEFIELTNIGFNAINLQNVAFTTGISFTFPSMNVNPGQHIVLVKNETAFRERYGTSIAIAGVYDGNLSNSGETLTLVDAGGLTIQGFTYLDDDWIPAADGPGYTMVVTDSGAATSAWSTPAGWRRSANINGSPGAVDPAYVDGDYDRSGEVDASDYVLWRKTQSQSVTLFTEADGNGNGLVDAADYDVWRAHFGETAVQSANGAELDGGGAAGGAMLADPEATAEGSENVAIAAASSGAASARSATAKSADESPNSSSVGIARTSWLPNSFRSASRTPTHSAPVCDTKPSVNSLLAWWDSQPSPSARSNDIGIASPSGSMSATFSSEGNPESVDEVFACFAEGESVRLKS